MPAPALLAIGLVLGFLVLMPARRLQLAGFSGRAVGLYASVLWALAFFLAVRPVAARILIPVLLVAYLAPFLVSPARLGRIVRRLGGGTSTDRGTGTGRDGDPLKPPIKNVTPPEADGSRGPSGR
jgi:hypothetical protein